MEAVPAKRAGPVLRAGLNVVAGLLTRWMYEPEAIVHHGRRRTHGFVTFKQGAQPERPLIVRF
jgi:hypothetical protein